MITDFDSQTKDSLYIYSAMHVILTFEENLD